MITLLKCYLMFVTAISVLCAIMIAYKTIKDANCTLFRFLGIILACTAAAGLIYITF